MFLMQPLGHFATETQETEIQLLPLDFCGPAKDMEELFAAEALGAGGPAVDKLKEAVAGERSEAQKQAIRISQLASLSATSFGMSQVPDDEGGAAARASVAAMTALLSRGKRKAEDEDGPSEPCSAGDGSKAAARAPKAKSAKSSASKSPSSSSSSGAAGVFSIFGSKADRKAAKAAAAKTNAVFVAIAGAGGKLPGEDDDGLLREPAKAADKSIRLRFEEVGTFIGPLKRANGKKLTGGGGCNAEAVALARDAAREAASKHPGRPIFFVGQSFGSRLSVHALISATEVRTPPNVPKPWTDPNGADLPSEVKGAVLCGYPLAHERQDRSKPIRMALGEQGKKLLFVHGSRDGSDQLQSLLAEVGSVSIGGAGGAAAAGGGSSSSSLSGTSSSSGSASSSMYIVPNGDHNPFDSKPARDQAAKNVPAVDAITRFVLENGATST